MLVKERFCNFLFKKNILKILISISVFIYFTTLQGSEKLNIINNFNNLNTLKFNFAQKSFEKEEFGVCYLKRPYYLRCLYEDKNQKELIINNKILVIYHKRYKKVYRYPLSKSFFLDILNKEKFSRLIENGESSLNDNYYEISYLDEDRGEITFFFEKKNYDLYGWRLVDINNNIIKLEIKNSLKNIDIKKNFFLIPLENQ